ncbi:DUF4232 domain-containing protein [Streptomyces sp. NBC_00572]|uniref:DUF4232 domain-containing protein n=1 Tax=Streptomyces sp. NBC_00572 TaxID=2903664 RepID=UPI00224EAE9C|nr:DUF4232 domain-containing protein [Streptomyces sp. NBC_00572]MCX4982512.1 DUF4232 domain-containing protein [Streptomyces sp. NBC_00572]
MSTVRRNTRRTWKVGALGLTAAALLSATACGPSDDEAGGTPPSPTRSTAPASEPTAPTTGPASPSTQPGDSGSTDGSPSASEPPGTTGETDWEPKDGICSDLNTEVKADWALPPVKDDSKLELVITNTSDKPCKLYHYPMVKFGNELPYLSVVKSSKPQSVIVLGPGKEAYAGVLARSGSKEVASFEKMLIKAPQGKELPPADTKDGMLLELPAKGVYVDKGARVSYWRADSESAISALYPQ